MNKNKQLRDSFWHLLCHRTELPESGNFLKLNWLDEEVSLFNDGGEIVVFDNLCPHRGTRFFTKLHGAGAISCPYHGWSYRSGAMHIPCKEQYDQAEISKAGLNFLKSDWCGDFLFVSISPSFTLEEQLGAEFEHLASISFDIGGRSDFDAYTYECDWRIAIENGLEPLHVPYIHADTLGQLNLSDPKNEYTHWNSAVYFSIGDAATHKKMRSIKKLFSIEEQFEGYMSIYLFPFTMLSSTFGYSYSLQNFFPSAEKNKTFFYSRLLNGVAKSPAAADALHHFFASSAAINRQVFKEDHEICKRISPNFYDEGRAKLLSKDEEKIAHFRQCLKKSFV
ncbi:aromatic ring-hydroxylating oxygenase subunit alpha [Undibacterium sp. TJN25]|uniref:aromatic ring-hydroxylating oxygenase subunit alpha n=1 Tax=Undibacterium sp. TJN25 TaxID=3413056 RepID=UPI003BF3D30D